jgi:hypothetical protein
LDRLSPAGSGAAWELADKTTIMYLSGFTWVHENLTEAYSDTVDFITSSSVLSILLSDLLLSSKQNKKTYCK